MEKLQKSSGIHGWRLSSSSPSPFRFQKPQKRRRLGGKYFGPTELNAEAQVKDIGPIQS